MAFGIINEMQSWETEIVIFDGDTWFSRLEVALDAAKKSIDLEAYAFASDSLGTRISAVLIRAAARGVKVRVMVDGVGSAGWVFRYANDFRQAKIQFRIYNQLPWEKLLSREEPGDKRIRFIDLLRRINNRNHRKLCLIDTTQAWLGGMNIWNVHLASVHGDAAWRDTGVCVEGSGIQDFADSFSFHWMGLGKRILLRFRRWRRREILFSHPLVLQNSTRKHRQANYKNLLARIRRSKERIWITNAYFVPPGSLVRALRRAAGRGVDVRVLVPGKSDIFFMPWAISAFYYALLRGGVKVYEYQKAVLHAKSMIIDDWAVVGSSNLNHRSILHDLELDVVLTHQESYQALSHQYEKDLEVSVQLPLDRYLARPFWSRFLSKIALAFRYWI